MGKRQLRSTENPVFHDESLEPPGRTKQTKTTKPHFECHICCESMTSRFFPEFNPTDECVHLIHTCKSCLAQWVETRVGDGEFEKGGDGKLFGVRCPECLGIMKKEDVEAAASKKVFKRFQELERRHVADTVHGWRWCLNPHCKAGQVHEQATPKTMKGTQKGDKQPDADLCICNKCGHTACVPCDRPDHSPETCAEYQARIKGHAEEDEKSRAALLKISKPCPKCKKPIQKDGGCSTMRCTGCRADFCWSCCQTYKNGKCGCTAG